MAKTIKFNLILDGKPVRTIEDLEENFSIENILDVYNNRLLHRWLEVRGYTDFLEQVNSIKDQTNIERIKKLIKIFEIECDDARIEEIIAILDFKIKREEVLEDYKKIEYNAKVVIGDYHAGYDDTVKDIIENKDNLSKIKDNIKKIEENYIGLFKLNYKDLYNTLISKAPLAVFAILMNNKMRRYFIANKNSNEDTNFIYKDIKEFIKNDTVLKSKLGKSVKLFYGNTKGNWKEIEPKDKKVMIISMKEGNSVRNSGLLGQELSSFNIKNSFIVLSGIDYKSNNSYHKLLYMEV